jgi:hypothetical protein
VTPFTLISAFFTVMGQAAQVMFFTSSVTVFSAARAGKVRATIVTVNQ